MLGNWKFWVSVAVVVFVVHLAFAYAAPKLMGGGS